MCLQGACKPRSIIKHEDFQDMWWQYWAGRSGVPQEEFVAVVKQYTKQRWPSVDVEEFLSPSNCVSMLRELETYPLTGQVWPRLVF